MEDAKMQGLLRMVRRKCGLPAWCDIYTAKCRRRWVEVSDAPSYRTSQSKARMMMRCETMRDRYQKGRGLRVQGKEAGSVHNGVNRVNIRRQNFKKKHPSANQPVPQPSHSWCHRWSQSILDASLFRRAVSRDGIAGSIGIFDKGGIPLGVSFYPIWLASYPVSCGFTAPHVIFTSIDAFL